MRDIGPIYLNRLEGDIVFVDPKNEFLHRQSNVDVLGKPGKGRGKIIYPIEDEAHKVVILEQITIGEKIGKSGSNNLLIEQESERVGSVAIEKWRDFRSGRLIVDECHNIYDPEADRLVEKLRNRGNKRLSSSDQI
jgi:hypothetical protein